MIGTKERVFSPLSHDVSLEDLVPQDNFYRRLEKTLDLSFVRDLVRPLYARGGRSSVDPVVFFRLQLVMFFEDIRSERELMRVAAAAFRCAGFSATTSTSRYPITLASQGSGNATV